jgi:UDP-3-O-[3-hydroxymyristoyl] glucosamine N-acyltransferase
MSLFCGYQNLFETEIKQCSTFCAIIGSRWIWFPSADGTFKKIPQIGNVIIEDDVDVGSCTTIDRPRIDYY